MSNSKESSKAKIYDGYFSGQYQELHHYDNDKITNVNNPRFFGPVLPTDGYMIQKTADKVMDQIKGDTFTVVDHGSGDGRNFGEVLKIAKKAEKRGMNVHYKAYDISSGGLGKFKQRLEDYNKYSKEGDKFEGLDDINFKEVKKEISELGYGGYNAGSSKKGNLEVSFIHNDEIDCAEHSKNLIGPISMAMSVFGSLSHTTKKSDRNEALSVFNEMLEDGGAIYATLPSKRRFPDQQKAFDTLRGMGMAPSGAEEEDVVYYKRDDGTVLPYKLFSESKLKEEFTEAGFKDVNVGISNAVNQDTLFQYAWLAQAESLLTSIIPGLPAEYGHYMYAVASPGKSKDISASEQTLSTAPAATGTSASPGSPSLNSQSSVSVEGQFILEGLDQVSERSVSSISGSSMELRGGGISEASMLSSDGESEENLPEHKRNHSKTEDVVGELPDTKRNRSGSFGGGGKSKSWSAGLNTRNLDMWADEVKNNGSIVREGR